MPLRKLWIPIRFSRDFVDRIRSKGGTPILTEVDGVGHNAWTPAYANTTLVNWLLAQRRGTTSSVTPNLAITNPPPSGAAKKSRPFSPVLFSLGPQRRQQSLSRVFARHHKLGINIPGELKPPANGTTQWTSSTDLVDGENQISVIAEGNAAAIGATRRAIRSSRRLHASSEQRSRSESGSLTLGQRPE